MGPGTRKGDPTESYALAEPISTLIPFHFPRLNTITLRIALVRWPSTIANHISAGSRVENV